MQMQNTALLQNLNVCFLSGSKTPLQSFLGIAEQHTAHNGVRTGVKTVVFLPQPRNQGVSPFDFSLLCQSNVSQCASPHNPTAITAEEYFDPEFNLNGRDIGRPIELTSKVQKYGTTVGCQCYST